MSIPLQYSTLGFLFGSFLFLSTSAFAADGNWSIGKQFMIFQQQGSSSNVFVGVGKENPQSKLDVAGKVQSESTKKTDTPNTLVTKDFLENSIGEINPGQWKEKNGNLYRNSGNIGINTDIPEEKLHINGNLMLQESLFLGGTEKDGTLSVKNNDISLSAKEGKNIKITNHEGKGVTIGTDGNTSIERTLSSEIFSFENIQWRNGKNISLKDSGEYSFDFDEGNGESTFHIYAPDQGDIFSIKSNGETRIKGRTTFDASGSNNEYLRMINPESPAGKQNWSIFDTSDTGTLAIKPRNDDWSWKSEALAITHDGKIGIGTIDPQIKLDVLGNMRVQSETLYTYINIGKDTNDSIISDNNSNKHYGGGYFFRVDNGAGSYIDSLRLAENGNIGIKVSPSSSLDLAIGDSDTGLDQNGDGVLEIKANYQTIVTATTSGIDMNNKSITGVSELTINDPNEGINFHDKASLTTIDDNTDDKILITASKVGIGMTPTEKLEVNGKVKATAFVYPSDKRLKKNIVKIQDPLQKISEIKGVTFDWKDSGKSDIGVIAQDVEKIFPVAVSTNPETGIKAVDYPRLVPLLVASIQAQQEEISHLKQEISELKK